MAASMIIHKTDGSSVAEDIERISFSEPVKWVRENVEAVNTQQIIFYSETVGDSVSFHIYLPDKYETEPHDHFPVLYWLHGSGAGLLGITVTADFFHNATVRPLYSSYDNSIPLRFAKKNVAQSSKRKTACRIYVYQRPAPVCR